MYTVIETPPFQKQAAKVFTEEELHAFIDWIAQNPATGDVIPGADGARKVRWGVQGKGKRGGARVVYFSKTEEGFLLLVACYAKSDRENITNKEIKELSNE